MVSPWKQDRSTFPSRTALGGTLLVGVNRRQRDSNNNMFGCRLAVKEGEVDGQICEVVVEGRCAVEHCRFP